jgi:hypothetical protein
VSKYWDEEAREDGTLDCILRTSDHDPKEQWTVYCGFVDDLKFDYPSRKVVDTYTDHDTVVVTLAPEKPGNPASPA